MTVTLVTLRPNGTVKQQDVITTSAVAPHTVLSDNNDSTRAQGQVDNAVLLLDMGTTTLGALRVYEARVKVRDAHDTVGGGFQRGWIRFRDPNNAGTGISLGQFTLVRGGTDPQYQYGPKTAAGPGGVAWSQALVNRLQVELAWKTSDDGNYLGVQEVYVEMWTYAQPSVSGVTVTGAGSTTRPTVTWSYTGDLPQSRFRVYVYSAAQYGAAGFVAGSSTATWDSGDQFGSAETFDVTADLQNGTTYKAYVKAAYDWTGRPEGELWWSALAVSSTFTIAVIPPPRPTLTATPETTLPSYRTRLVVSLDDVNRLTAQQASLEDTTTSGWFGNTNCSISNVSSWSADGTRALQMSSTAAGDMSAGASGTRVRGGQRVVAVATGRSVAVARSVRVALVWKDAVGSVIGSAVNGTATNDATGADTVWYVTGVAPANVYTVDILVNVLATGGASELHRFDKFAVYYHATDPGTAAAANALWTPGGYAQNGTVTVERTQRISANIGRGPARNWLHPQIHSSGALTTSTDGFYPRAASDAVTARLLDTAPPEAPGNTSAGMLDWEIRAGTYLDIGAPDGTATDGQHPYLFPAVPAKDMTFSVWMKSASAITIRLALYYVDSVNTSLGLTFSSTVALTSSWQKVSVTATPPAGTVYARGLVENNSATNDRSVRLTQPTFRPVSEPAESWPGQVWSFEWETVRSSPPIPQDGTDPVVYDHEAPPGRPIIYRATTIGLNPTGQSLASPPSTQVAVYMDLPLRNVIKDIWQPENAAVVNIARYSESQGQDAQVFHALGRDGDPVLIRDWLGGQDGSYEMACLSDREFYRLKQLLPSARPLLIQFADGGQHYCLITDDRSTERVAPGTWKTTVKAVQCRRPA